MLPAQYRLRKKLDIEAVLKRGRSAYTPNISVRLAKNQLGVSRFAFVAGLKVSKSAVKRNRVRRQLREIVRKHLGAIAAGYDVMVMTKPAILQLKFGEMEKELLGLFKKQGIV
ncbi:MAG: ribonuclease P protein component [Patescibacteria group bacterium]|nr:ribonuclease P protein component [Patescibacteria group bacterium]